MIFPSNRVRVLVATQPVDFRKGHDGLCALVASTLRKDHYTGTVFVFRARRADRLKSSCVLLGDIRLEIYIIHPYSVKDYTDAPRPCKHGSLCSAAAGNPRRPCS